MNAIEELVKAALTATEDQKEEAVRVRVPSRRAGTVTLDDQLSVTRLVRNSSPGAWTNLNCASVSTPRPFSESNYWYEFGTRCVAVTGCNWRIFLAKEILAYSSDLLCLLGIIGNRGAASDRIVVDALVSRELGLAYVADGGRLRRI